MQAPDQHDLMEEAVSIAKEADAVILIVGTILIGKPKEMIGQT